jgi:hypothetical protein
MIRRREILIGSLSLAALVCGSALAQKTLTSPAQVQKALGTLNRVVGHTQRLIAAGNFARLPHENAEFEEGLEALERGIAREPSDFKAKVEPFMKQAKAASQGLADASVEHDATQLDAAHKTLENAVQQVLRVFPDSVRPPQLAQ